MKTIKTILSKTSYITLSLVVGLTLAAGVTFAAWTATWHGTSWINSGETISAQKIAENFEYLKAEMDLLENALGNSTIGGIPMISAESTITMSHNQAALYCRNLSAAPDATLEGSVDTTIYTDWRMPDAAGLSMFEGITSSDTPIWMTTTEGEYDTYWGTINLSNGISSYSSAAIHTRCVRQIPTVVTRASAESSTTLTHKDAASYCRNLSAAPDIVYEGGTDTAVYTTWRMPSWHELSLFEGLTSSITGLWTGEVGGYGDRRTSLGLGNSSIHNPRATSYMKVRCVL